MRSRAGEVQQEDSLLRRIDPARLPRHVAIIMDGNGRWARERHLPRTLGHVRGADTVERIIKACRDLPERLQQAGCRVGDDQRIQYLTLYTFSNEN